nr:DUF4012 domain-containing protein [Microbacterium bovistercoris]
MSRTVRTKWLVWGLAAAVVVVVAAVAWVGVRAVMAKGELEAATASVGGLQAAVNDQNLSKLQQIAEDVGPRVQRAAELTGDPIWRATEVVPVLGNNLAAARVASAELDALVNTLALPLTTTIPELSNGSGGIDVAALQNISDTLTAADAELQDGQRELAGLDLTGVIPAVSDGVRQLQTISDQVTPIVHDAGPFTRIAPQLLGADGPRRILLVVQNNAELRTAGGISGTFVELTADKGKIALTRVASDAEFPTQTKPVADVPASTSQLYGDAVGLHVQNTTMPAAFTLSAELATSWWKTIDDDDPDVVMSIDPVVLASLLNATGPVKVAGITLNVDNAVRQLLVNSYLELDEKDQDPFFAAAAAAVFNHLTDGSADPLALVQALQQPLADGRISMWSAHPNEQKVLGASALGGPAARHAAAGENAYSVYFNDATGSKMDSFLKVKITGGSATCKADDRRDVAITVTVRSDAPKDAATSLPGVVTGWGLSGTPAGDIRTVVSVAAPPGTFFAGVSVDDKLTTSPDVSDAGFPTSAATVLLRPGQEKTIEFRFLSAGKGDADPVILHTPMMVDPEVTSASLACG